jgi:hypothetical protein
MLSTLGKLKAWPRRLSDDDSGGVTVIASITVIGLALLWYVMDQRFDIFAGKIVAALEHAVADATTGTAPIIDGGAAGG